MGQQNRSNVNKPSAVQLVWTVFFFSPVTFFALPVNTNNILSNLWSSKRNYVSTLAREQVHAEPFSKWEEPMITPAAEALRPVRVGVLGY